MKIVSKEYGLLAVRWAIDIWDGAREWRKKKYVDLDDTRL